jgi:hypothetical protein
MARQRRALHFSSTEHWNERAAAAEASTEQSKNLLSEEIRSEDGKSITNNYNLKDRNR